MAASLHSSPYLRWKWTRSARTFARPVCWAKPSERGARFGFRKPEYVAEYAGFRQQAGRELECFINDHIYRRRSFAFETTLREVTFEQTRRATRNGFRVEMIFVAGGDAKDHAERVAERGMRGGHIASEGVLFEIYERSMKMLRRAFEENKRTNIEILAVYDNPRMPVDEQPRPSLVVEMVRGNVARIRDHSPDWFHAAMRGTPFEFRRLQERRSRPHRE